MSFDLCDPQELVLSWILPCTLATVSTKAMGANPKLADEVALTPTS